MLYTLLGVVIKNKVMKKGNVKMLIRNLREMEEKSNRLYTLLGDVWVKPDKPLDELPEGTKAKALGGGYWIKNKRGWKWCTGATFPNVGGDWDGTVLLPK